MCKDLIVINKKKQAEGELSDDFGFKEIVAACARCGGLRFIKNGFTASGRQNYRCKSCGKQSDFNPENTTPTFEIRQIIEGLLKENVAVVSICRATGVPRGQIYTIRKKLLSGEN